MADYRLLFNCCIADMSIEVKEDQGYVDLKITCRNDNNKSTIAELSLTKSTAIKFAKTLRTEINKIKESEVNNEA